jgi:hypothetical protein
LTRGLDAGPYSHRFSSGIIAKMVEAPPPSIETAATDKMAVVKLYVDLANSEKQAIWARQATMLVGNSILLSGISADKGSHQLFNFAGLGLCVVWAIMTYSGWSWFYKVMQDAKELVPDPSLNPFAKIPQLARRLTDTIFLCAMAVVAIFAFVYVIGLVPTFRSIAHFICGS